MPNKTILGIDPGYARMGWGVINVSNSDVKCLGFGCIETPKEEEMGTRLAYLNDALIQILDRYKPTDIAVEELFFAKNAKTAMNVAQARGIVMMRASYHSGRIFQYRPNVIKESATGIKGANKTEMQTSISKTLGFVEVIKPDDAADALAVAICHAVKSQESLA